jgi:16S rRNA (cytosine967-C5)-methyltransferase
LTQRQLEQRMGEQAAILNAAHRHVKPGGRLVYVTCSLFPEENTDRVTAFLSGNPDFQPADHSQRLADICPAIPPSAAIISETGITFTPLRTGTDGFFVSVMKRN